MIKIVSSSLPNYMKYMLIDTGFVVLLKSGFLKFGGHIYESTIIHQN